MTWDDCVYGLLLLISIGCAIISSRSGSFKKFFMGITGLLIVSVVCGLAIWHSLVVTVVSIFCICLFPKRSHIIVFITCFGYLVFFRTCHLLGFDKPPSHSNAVQLILTLKLIGAAFEVQDSVARDERLRLLLGTECERVAHDDDNDNGNDDIEQLRREIRYLSVKADPLDLFLYSYCFVGLLTGPYFKYRVFLDCLDCQVDSLSPPMLSALIGRMQTAFLIGLAYLAMSHFYFIEYAKSEEVFSRPLAYRLVFMALMFLVFRLRMYFAWLVSECVCRCAGLGLYPAASAPLPGQGPTDLEALHHHHHSNSAHEPLSGTAMSFETVRNVDMAGCEWAPSVRDGMRAWNMSVQFWLASFVYRRCPVRSMRTPVTMLVSAFWHGVHPGYYLSFMTIPLALGAESALHSLVGPPDIPASTSTSGGQSPWAVLRWPAVASWLFKMRVFDYCAMGFLLLEAGATWRYWCSIGLCMHLLMGALLVAGAFRSRVGLSPR